MHAFDVYVQLANLVNLGDFVFIVISYKFMNVDPALAREYMFPENNIESYLFLT